MLNKYLLSKCTTEEPRQVGIALGVAIAWALQGYRVVVIRLDDL